MVFQDPLPVLPQSLSMLVHLHGVPGFGESLPSSDTDDNAYFCLVGQVGRMVKRNSL